MYRHCNGEKIIFITRNGKNNFFEKKDFWELFLEHFFLYLEPKNDHCTLEFLLHCYGASLNFISQTLHGTPEQHQGPKMATNLGLHSI